MPATPEAQTVDSRLLETVLVEGDLSRLDPPARLHYYQQVCTSLGLNPLTRPFEYVILNNRLQLYAKRDATDQLRKKHNISVRITHRDVVEGVYIVTATGEDQGGRTDEATGAVAIDGLTGDMRANAMMKAETKAKRRLTLSLVGLGWLDESEVSAIPGALIVNVDPDTGDMKPDLPRRRDLIHEAAVPSTRARGEALVALGREVKRLSLAPSAGSDLVSHLFPGTTSARELSDQQLHDLTDILARVPTGTEDVLDAVFAEHSEATD